MPCKRHGLGVTVRYLSPTSTGQRGHVMRCSYCRRVVSLGPSNDDTPDVIDELTAIEVVAGERAFFGQTSGAFRIGFHGDRDDYFDPPNTFDEKTRAHCIRLYQSGAFAAHLMTEVR